MKKLFLILSIVFLVPFPSLFGQSGGEYLGKAKLYKEKKYALNYLSRDATVEKFGRISDAIWSYAELGMQEFKSAALLMNTLDEEGFTIEKNVAGIPTAFVATYGSGKPVIGILGEFDALPMISQKGLTVEQAPLVRGGPGHGCGHNTMGTAGSAAAIAVKKTMDEYGLQGTIKFYGCPAEETVISRPYMVRSGVFDDVDAIIDNHSSTRFGTGYGVSGNALISVMFTFSGKTAHSAGAPWNGRSALDAVEIMNVATNYMREHLHYTHRMHYVIPHAGEAPNVVPDKATVWYYVRNTDERVEEMYQQVVNCAKAAALATDTELEEIRVLTGIHQRHSNKGMAELLQQNIELVGMPKWSEEEQEFAKKLQAQLGKEETGMPSQVNKLRKPSGIQVGGGSSDVGEVTLIAPTATLGFPAAVPGAIFHHWSAVACFYGSAAWKGLNAGAKVMAAGALDLMTDKKRLQKIREEFSEYSKKHPYKPFLPEDAEPPLDLNQELMEKFLPHLKKVYIEVGK
jgi:aminobenzoyl-glutamate utilization protein B